MKIKKAILAMVCAVSMMASMIPVSAEEVAIGRANHVHVWGDKQEIDEPYISISDTQHEKRHKTVKRCQDYATCRGELVLDSWSDVGSHRWLNAYDRGHKGESEHAFQLECSICHGGPEIRILCEYNQTGRHNTPW